MAYRYSNIEKRKPPRLTTKLRYFGVFAKVNFPKKIREPA
jgi:hypothetical protein